LLFQNRSRTQWFNPLGFIFYNYLNTKKTRDSKTAAPLTPSTLWNKSIMVDQVYLALKAIKD